jgi:hypothetical protein
VKRRGCLDMHAQVDVLALGEHDVIGAEARPASVDLGQLLLDCVADHVVLAERKDIDLGVLSRQTSTWPPDGV